MGSMRRHRLKPIESNLVFNSDILARSLLRIHVPRYEAYQIAHQIWQKTAHQKRDAKALKKLVEGALKKKHPHSIKAYRQWEAFMKSKKPLILLLEGATGIGTSTLAVRMGWLLEVNHIVGTDAVREVIRQFLGKEVLPLLHVSTYQTAALIEEVKSDHDRLIHGFLEQSQEVLNGVDAIIKRAIKENMSTIIEGVHLVPGRMSFLEKYKHKAHIIEVMLDVNQPSKHRLHFLSRQSENGNRSKREYLKHFKEIRLIRDFLVKEAKKNHISILENYDLRKVEQAVLEIIYSQHNSKHGRSKHHRVFGRR